MIFTGQCFNVIDEDLFRKSVQGLQKSLGTPNDIFVSDNLITWNKTMGFLQKAGFLEFIQTNSTSPIEQAIVWRTYVLCWFARLALAMEGDFLEVGCYMGSTARTVIEQTQLAASGRKYYLYDLFDRHPTAPGNSVFEHGPALYERVRQRFAEMPFVELVRGEVPASFDRSLPRNVAFAHIDLNSAPAELAALEQIYPRLSDGGIIILDDYGWAGYVAQKDVEDTFFGARGIEILELPTGQGVAIKNYGAKRGSSVRTATEVV